MADFLTGGDLRFTIKSRKNQKFTEKESKFFIACLVLGLEYLHKENVLHRDIKPDNLVLDDRGYLRITDLGIAKVMKAQNSSDTSGTPGYMSPEVLAKKDHGIESDYFSVGVIAYELMLGKRPYEGKSRKEVKD